MNALAKLSAATTALAEAKTLDDVKHILDLAEAARTYAKAAKLGLEAQNHAAEIKLRAERKAGELLKELERGRGNNQYTEDHSSLERSSPYRQVLTESDIAPTTAHRWQTVASLPEQTFEQRIAEVKATGDELTTTTILRTAKEFKREQKRQENRELVEQAPVILDTAANRKFQTIVLDPPWDWGDEGDVDQLGRARPTYHTMSIDEIALLPVADLADTNAHLYLWITNRSLPKGFRLLETWGFRYITCLTWCKPHFGMGNYFRGSTEQVLFGVKGSLSLLRHDVGTWFEAQRGNRHSEKPQEFYALVESCSPGPWLEMFARQQRNGWYAWGAEANGIL